MFSPRSFRLRLRLALCLALATVLTTLAAPLQASPLDRAAIQGPVLGLIDWVQGLLASIGGPEAGAQQPNDPSSTFLPGSNCIDPDGVQIPCPKTITSERPTESGYGVEDRRGEDLRR